MPRTRKMRLHRGRRRPRPGTPPESPGPPGQPGPAGGGPEGPSRVGWRCEGTPTVARPVAGTDGFPDMRRAYVRRAARRTLGDPPGTNLGEPSAVAEVFDRAPQALLRGDLRLVAEQRASERQVRPALLRVVGTALVGADHRG